MRNKQKSIVVHLRDKSHAKLKELAQKKGMSMKGLTEQLIFDAIEDWNNPQETNSTPSR